MYKDIATTVQFLEEVDIELPGEEVGKYQL
jgi:hypothetical protein